MENIDICTRSSAFAAAGGVIPDDAGAPPFSVLCYSRMGSFDIQRGMHVGAMNPREHRVVAMSRRGNDVSLSPGERAGVRVSVKRFANVCVLSVPRLRFVERPGVRCSFSYIAFKYTDLLGGNHPRAEPSRTGLVASANLHHLDELRRPSGDDSGDFCQIARVSDVVSSCF